jgi:hypothetical protein
MIGAHEARLRNIAAIQRRAISAYVTRNPLTYGLEDGTHEFLFLDQLDRTSTFRITAKIHYATYRNGWALLICPGHEPETVTTELIATLNKRGFEVLEVPHPCWQRLPHRGGGELTAASCFVRDEHTEDFALGHWGLLSDAVRSGDSAPLDYFLGPARALLANYRTQRPNARIASVGLGVGGWVATQLAATDSTILRSYALDTEATYAELLGDDSAVEWECSRWRTWSCLLPWTAAQVAATVFGRRHVELIRRDRVTGHEQALGRVTAQLRHALDGGRFGDHELRLVDDVYDQWTWVKNDVVGVQQ